MAKQLNRAEQTRRDNDRVGSRSMSLKDVDEAIIYHLTQNMKLRVVQDGRTVQVSVVMSAQDKCVQTRKNAVYKDANGQIVLPVVVVTRTGETDDTSYQIFNEPQTFELRRQWSKSNRYDRFSVLNNWVPREEIYSVTFPQHMMVNYDVIIWTEKINHMNALKEKIMFLNPSYWGPDNNTFLVTSNGFSNAGQLEANENKNVKATFSLEVRAAILPEDYNDATTIQKTSSTFNVATNASFDGQG